MDVTLGDKVLASLEDLKQYDFERFKDKLSDFFYEDIPPIPCGHLEKADYVATKNRLIDVYGKESVLDVTIRVLNLINLKGHAEKLEMSRENVQKLRRTKLEDFRTKYMEHMKNKYHVFEDGNARIGEIVHLQLRYTSLLFRNKHQNEEEREHEITAAGWRHLQIMEQRSSEDYSPTNIHSLFDPDKGGSVSKSVVIQGPAGFGKTMTTQKIMLDWASENLYRDRFKFVFYMSCRELNTVTGDNSLAGLMRKICDFKCNQDLLKSVFEDSERILFIIDGFDELKLSINDAELCEDPFQVTTKDILLNSLLRQRYLREASMIITTRPYSLTELKNLVKYPRYVEILGFTGKDRKKYFYNFFETKEKADLALGIIKDNDTLFTMCVVPIICCIICTLMNQQMEHGMTVADCKTSTAIYLFYLKSLIKYHGRGINKSTNSSIKKLCAVANEGIWEQKFLFEEEDLKRHGLSMTEPESTFLNENIFQRGVETQTSYSFIHLSVQEFFAALHYLLEDTSVTGRIFPRTSEMNRFLQELCRKPQFELTAQFLFGLSNGKNIQEIERCLGCKVSLRDKSPLEDWLKKPRQFYDNLSLKCLYEVQDEDLVERIMPHYLRVEVHHRSLFFSTPFISYWKLSYCLMNSKSVHEIKLHEYDIAPEAREALAPALGKCSKIFFEGCFPQTMGTEEISCISGLFKSCRRIQELELRLCGLTSSCCDELCSVIRNNRSLIKLDLRWNKLQDCGVKVLCQELKQRECSLQELRLRTFALSCLHGANVPMLTLDLTNNNQQDCGVTLVSEGFRQRSRTLHEQRVCDGEETQKRSSIKTHVHSITRRFSLVIKRNPKTTS
ncbi:NACHT, LRR and PYD domains-containing protein 3-like isoform X2 [Pseudophryne corroboree]|uniref:NACHT, LRR and PYD domains-containing protein 3-like isoform X2 n=1 Tax=Pseudophryne corroboree TaxID=495146 RepID=UPI00308171A2